MKNNIIKKEYIHDYCKNNYKIILEKENPKKCCGESCGETHKIEDCFWIFVKYKLKKDDERVYCSLLAKELILELLSSLGKTKLTQDRDRIKDLGDYVESKLESISERIYYDELEKNKETTKKHGNKQK